MIAPSRALALGLVAAFALGACEDGGEVEPPALRIEILEVRAPSPLLEGSAITLIGIGLDAVGASPTLEVVSPAGSVLLPPAGEAFEFTAEAAARFGDGEHALTLTLLGDAGRSEPIQLSTEVATTLPVTLSEVPSGEVYWNGQALLRGSGFISAAEGALIARFEGDFTPDADGTPEAVSLSVPVSQAERDQRERAVVVLSPTLGGPEPGTWTGTVTLESTLRSGATSSSESLETSLHFNPPTLFDADPPAAWLGQLVTVRGGGFLGGEEGATLLRLEGSFAAADDPPAAFGPAEIVPRFLSGEAVEMVLEPTPEGDVLVSELFGASRGVFEGQASAVVVGRGGAEVTGDAVPFRFELLGVRQVVYLRFLPGFYDSLQDYGLSAAARAIEAGVAERIRGIFQGVAVDIRLEPPEDFSPNAYSVLEIGGTDPNGRGLLGYDNTPGKDVGNLRLFDAIGGANAETQDDGYPGYGGVFIESFLAWSSHPEVEGITPEQAEPAFDALFDPVRSRPATLAEVQGEGDAARVAEVRAAADALSAIIGETAAHEIGHSLGMAQPYGEANRFHNDGDTEGCLMDSGRDRPFGERAGLPGFAETRFCYEHPAYLQEILPER